MDTGLLSLKWNNHQSAFNHALSSVKKKDTYSDATLACDGKLYPVHKLVLSTCSDYFESIFDKTQCKHPVIVLKDISSSELESLLNYMYVGEANVLQDKLTDLIKAAESLRIKGLAVPDETPIRDKRSGAFSSSPEAKRRRVTSDTSRGSSRVKRDSERKQELLGEDSEMSNSSHASHGESRFVNNSRLDNSAVLSREDDNVDQSCSSTTSKRKESDSLCDPPLILLEESDLPIKEEPADSYTTGADEAKSHSHNEEDDPFMYDNPESRLKEEKEEDPSDMSVPGSSGLQMEGSWEDDGLSGLNAYDGYMAGEDESQGAAAMDSFEYYGRLLLLFPVTSASPWRGDSRLTPVTFAATPFLTEVRFRSTPMSTRVRSHMHVRIATTERDRRATFTSTFARVTLLPTHASDCLSTHSRPSVGSQLPLKSVRRRPGQTSKGVGLPSAGR